MRLRRHLRHHRASSTAEPIPRLEATQRTTQQRQPGATVNAAKNGPVVMAVAGGQEQRPRRQPSSRPIRGQRENPLSRREDNAPVFRSSNGSRTRNGRPANHSPRRINSAADRRCLWQEKRATLRLRHNNHAKKGTSRRSISYPFPFFPLSLSCNRYRERGIPRKGSFPVKEPGSEPPY
jgi:hypothetical protein